MRLPAALILFLSSSLVTAAEPLAEARLLWLKGNYAEARAIYESQPKNAAAACGVARTFVSEGESAKALATIDAALKAFPDDPALLAERADLLYEAGQWEDALKAAEKAIKLKDEQFLARWVRARILRDTGSLKDADTEMRWFVRTYTRRSNMDADIKDPDELMMVGQAGSENARWHSLSDQFEFILNDVYGDVLKIEPACWQAEYLAGSMLLEKMNLPEAGKAFNKALKLNPRAAEAHVGKGQAALIAFDLKTAEEYADLALKVNPKLPAALRLRADIHWAAGEIAKSQALLEQARGINGRDEATLARLAGCHKVMKNVTEFDKIAAEVERYNPRPALFYFDLADALEDRKLYTDAEKYYRKALELNDKLAGPKNQLGLLYLRLGKEDEARVLLDKAFTFDPFNVRVANSRKVLKHLTGYETKESKHYILKFDPKTDAVLAEFVLEFLEETHARLAKDFNYEFEGKMLIEIFNSHEMFSGRTVALPDLHTIGACTGRVVTMVSPRGKGLTKTFNWGRVIRHELVHIFNLAQTDYQVPHWLTEGLAVRNEGGSRPPAWSVSLRERFDSDNLFNLDNVLFGFVRPKSPEDWTMAYYQSYLYVEYLISAYKIEAVGRMLDAYAAGLDTDAAIKKVCGIEKAEFEKGYRAYLAALVKTFPVVAKSTDKSLTFNELQKAHDKDPADADIAAQLANELIRRKSRADARKLVDEVLANDKAHSLATVVKAKLLIADGDDEAARKLVEAAVAVHPRDVRLHGYLGKLLLDAQEPKAAAEQFELCRKLDPLSPDWLMQLKELYTKLDDGPKLIDVLYEIVDKDADDLDSRKQLARRLHDSKQYANAEAMARDALLIDVLDEEARNVFLEALRAQDKNDEADRMAKRYR